MGVCQQFSLAGNCGAALNLATRVFRGGNHISDEQRDKEQESAREKRRRNLRNLSEESLERSRGRRRKENFNDHFPDFLVPFSFRNDRRKELAPKTTIAQDALCPHHDQN